VQEFAYCAISSPCADLKSSQVLETKLFSA
jgi:hypothetical protein